MQNQARLEKSRPKTSFDVKKSLRNVVFAAIISLLLASCTTATSDNRPPTVNPPENDEAFASAVVALINDARSEARTCQNSRNGPTEYAATHPLTEDDRLEQAALRHSRDMAEHNFFAHKSETDDTTVRERVTSAGYDWMNVAETLVYGSYARSHEAAVEAWLESNNGHCDALMEPRFTEIGVGMIKNQDGVPYLTAVFAKPQP